MPHLNNWSSARFELSKYSRRIRLKTDSVALVFNFLDDSLFQSDVTRHGNRAVC